MQTPSPLFEEWDVGFLRKQVSGFYYKKIFRDKFLGNRFYRAVAESRSRRKEVAITICLELELAETEQEAEAFLDSMIGQEIRFKPDRLIRMKTIADSFTFSKYEGGNGETNYLLKPAKAYNVTGDV